MYCEAAGKPWLFVAAPGVKPLPRDLADNELYPLHVALLPDNYPEQCKFTPHPHKHICFMGDDGMASVWAPITSKPFLDYVLDWMGKDGLDLYGAGVEHIRTALEPVRAELADELTEVERTLMNDPSKWARPKTSAWCMVE